LAEEPQKPEDAKEPSEAAKPEAAKPEAAKPEAAKPEAAKPEAAKPEEPKTQPPRREPRRESAGPRELRPSRPRGRDGGGRYGGGRGRQQGGDESEGRYEERVVKINRCSTVVKGGRRFSFSALVVVGDAGGQVGVGFGKANEVPPSVEKAMKDARRSLAKVDLDGNTIPHEIVGRYRSSRVVMVPAAEGTGIIAGAAVRAVVECAGVKDILTKVHGSTNPLNVVKATLDGLRELRGRDEVMRLRGVEISI
jgi:small subunit ribosomal protein S5